jgi:hypothetical protein
MSPLTQSRTGSHVTATSPTERAVLAEFLRGIFPASSQMNSFDPDVLDWKYFSANPEWDGPRSYVVKNNENIVAHAGVWPIHIANSSQELKLIHLIDWAAARSAPGAGVVLVRQLASMCDLLMTIGGSPETQAILPKLGYRHNGEFKLLARVVRPFRQVIGAPNWNIKTPMRLARNTLWGLSSLPSIPSGWNVSSVPNFDESIVSILENMRTQALSSRKTVAGLNHFLNFPGTKFSAYVVRDSGKLCGYFLLSQVGGQTRIVDVGTDATDMTSICAIASRTAAELPDTCEIVAGSSDTQVQEVLIKLGFKVRQTSPIFSYDPRKLLPGDPSFSLSMLDGDMCFLANRRRPYLT